MLHCCPHCCSVPENAHNFLLDFEGKRRHSSFDRQFNALERSNDEPTSATTGLSSYFHSTVHVYLHHIQTHVHEQTFDVGILPTV